MHQICIIFCAIPYQKEVYFKCCFSHTFYREGQEVIIDCDPKQHSVITFWFKINRSGAKHLLTFKGTDVKENVDKEKYSLNKNAPSGKVSLAIKDFKKKTDSGLYTCAAMNSNKLFFGEPIEIKGEPGEKISNIFRLFLSISQVYLNVILSIFLRSRPT
uniref:Ig-like domain-containing protein n=1 Tax=Sinocyclocheilus rhinocerous TaxID=307959 RepID=A0A673IAX3_9TELE